jgi:hypothetical protein
MEHGNEMPEGHLHWNQAEYKDSRKDVLKTIIILSVVTITEVGVAIMLMMLITQMAETSNG